MELASARSCSCDDVGGTYMVSAHRVGLLTRCEYVALDIGLYVVVIRG